MAAALDYLAQLLSDNDGLLIRWLVSACWRFGRRMIAAGTTVGTPDYPADMTENYPRVLSVTDDRGNRNPGIGPDKSADSFYTGTELRPGDVVQLHCVGEDPKGRDLQWSMHAMGASARTRQSVSGTDVTLTWTVTEENVRDDLVLFIELTALGTSYHRAGKHDQQLQIHYKVSPPLDA